MLLDIAHEYVDIVIYPELILEIVAGVGNKKAITSLNQLIVVLVIISDTIDALLYDLQCYFGYIETLKYSLIFFVWLSIVGVNVENHELFGFCFWFPILLHFNACFTAMEACWLLRLASIYLEIRVIVLDRLRLLCYAERRQLFKNIGN